MSSISADLVDHRKLKVFSDIVFKADKLAAEECGQLPQRVDGLDQQWTAKVLGVNGKGGVDYPVLTQAAREWEAGAPQRAAERAREEAVREEWQDDSLVRSLVRGGTSKTLAVDIVQRERDKKNGLSPEEVKQRSRDRWWAERYAEDLANLELICEETVTMDEGRNPVRLDAAGLEEARSYLKEHGFPGDEAAHVRIDAFFDSWSYPDAPEPVGNGVAVPEVGATGAVQEPEVDVPYRIMPPLAQEAQPVRDPVPDVEAVVHVAEEPEPEPEAEPEPEPEPEPDVPEVPADYQAALSM